MGRPVEFIHTEVIDKAVDAFWRDGYEAISSNELADAMGVAKSSLYNSYGSKKGVLLHAIEHYSGDVSEYVRSLGSAQDLAACVREFIIDMTAEPAREHGCLLVNMATELGARDQEIRERVQEGFSTVQKSFAALLKVAQKEGLLSAELDPQSYALSLVTGIAGIRVLAKSGFTRKQLSPFIDLLLSKLK
jgi:TetR/AcrR family transcriptional repressor of nem operon